MRGDRSTGFVLSDFNTANLVGYLQNEDDLPVVDVSAAPYGQVQTLLVEPAHPIWPTALDFVIVWTRPESVLGAFRDLLDRREAAPDRLAREVDDFAALLGAIARPERPVFVPTWTLPPFLRGLGVVDLKDPSGLRGQLLAANARLVERLRPEPSVFTFDADRWMASAGRAPFHNRLWYAGKIPYANEVFIEAGADFKAALRALSGRTRKLLVLDLDGTLWGGLVGEVGWDALRLGGHDPAGEAFVDFQCELARLKRRGVLLAIASKNDEAKALEALDRHPEMVLRPRDFVARRINWRDKAENIAEMVAELNLGLDSVVFVDDQPAERARVREVFPEVYVPEWPEDVLEYRKALLSLRCFDTAASSAEDLQRTALYQDEGERKRLKDRVGSLTEWLETLAIRVQIEELGPQNVKRAAQLLNKTNQMNLSTRRLSEAELLAWARQKDHRFWTFRLQDRFGDAGLIGLASFEAGDAISARLVDFVLSCRVFGRKVEETMIATVISNLRQAGRRTLLAQYLPTAKNGPCLEFLQNSGLRTDDGSLFTWDLSAPYALPESIQVEGGPQFA